MNGQTEQKLWPENVIVADADYVDHVAFHLIVNFERMLNRRIPKADMAQWIVCIGLDGGMRPTENAETSTQVILLHDKQHTCLENFLPADYSQELNGQAFRDERLGEFQIAATEVESNLVTRDDLLLDIVGTVLARPEVKRVMIVPNAEEGTLYDDLRETLRRHDADDKRVTVFTMEPLQGGRFQQEMLGYSLTAALGIRGEELGSEK